MVVSIRVRKSICKPRLTGFAAYRSIIQIKFFACRALTHPGRDWQWFAYYDPTLHVVRLDPRFQAAVANIEAELVQQRANVQAMRKTGEIRTLAELYPEQPEGL